jgi:predicted CXXCH cytochrome family protein
VNRAWLEPSTRICTSCHDDAATFGHTQLMTWNGTETCNVCHDEKSQLSVDKVHAISDPYVPPYPREKE